MKKNATFYYFNAKHFSYRPWDNNNDIQQIENNYVVKTISRHSKRKTGNSEQLGSDNTSEASESDEEVIEPKIKKKEIVPAKSKPITPEVADERIKVGILMINLVICLIVGFLNLSSKRKNNTARIKYRIEKIKEIGGSSVFSGTF